LARDHLPHAALKVDDLSFQFFIVLFKLISFFANLREFACHHFQLFFAVSQFSLKIRKTVLVNLLRLGLGFSEVF
jgi:hypothetical protein